MSGTGSADVTITGLTWTKVLVIVGSVLGSALATIVVLLTVVYGGINERICRAGHPGAAR